MKLVPRLIITALAAAIPMAVGLYLLVDYFRDQERRVALQRVVTAQLTDDTRQRCESLPNWFLAGPRPDRPSEEILKAPDADVNAPRPPTQELPFEYFAYDESYQALSSAGPRFPNDLKQELRRGTVKSVTAPFPSRGSGGWQVALATGWERSPCQYLIYRIHPLPGLATQRVITFVSFAASLAVLTLVVAAPLVLRTRKLGLQARQSAADEYRSSIDSKGRDELSALAHAFNEAATDIRRRATDVKDRDDSLKRYIGNTTESVTTPLRGLVERLGAAAAGDRAAAGRALIDAHSLVNRLQNLSTTATLRMSIETPPTGDVSLRQLIEKVIEEQKGFAQASGVTVATTLTPAALRVRADVEMLQQAIANLVDNAIRYNRPGGHVAVSLDRTADGRFSLRVTDDGPGAPDDVIAKLNANRRFRGDEGKAGRKGELGLGLAVVREVADRSGMQWAFRKNAKGWFEAELTGPLV